VRKKAPTIFFPTCAPSPKREGKEQEITEETEKNEHKSPVPSVASCSSDFDLNPWILDLLTSLHQLPEFAERPLFQLPGALASHSQMRPNGGERLWLFAVEAKA
jgi:hypothetical protein